MPGALSIASLAPKSNVHHLRGVLDRQKAALGVLISLQPPTGPMEAEAASAGFYEHKTVQQ